MSGKNPNQVAGGHKATMHNPNVSEETKERASQHLDEMNSEEFESDAADDNTDTKNRNNVLGGYKATLKNPNVGEEAKQHAEDVLKAEGAI